MNVDARMLLSMLPHLASMKATQWKSPERLEELQSERLRMLIRHASCNVPFYRKALRGKDVRSAEDLSSLPLTTKEDARGTDAFTSAAHAPSGLSELRTSGSSGTPLLVRYSSGELAFKLALRYHFLLESGLRPTDIQAFVTYREYPWTMLQRLGIFRCHCLSFLDREEKNLAAIRRTGASSLISYPSCLAPLARWNAENGPGIRLKAAFSSAEQLTPEARALISRSFSCSVRDRYGAIETGSVAWECGKGSMHVYDSVIAEVVDDDGRPLAPGRKGNLAITPLWRYSMPFIRYVIGDRASLGRRCACGRGLPVLASFEGRNNQHVVLPSGRRYIATAIGAKLRAFDIMQFQAVQEERGKLRLVLVPVPGRPRPEPSRVRAEVSAILPEPMEIEVEFAERLERSHRGKLCDFVSRIKI